MQLTANHSRSDKVLFYGLLVWFLFVFSLSIVSNLQGAQREHLFLVQGSEHSLSYPVIDYFIETQEVSLWQLGDELLALDGQTLQGASSLHAFAVLATQASDGFINVTIRRDGAVKTIDAVTSEPIVVVATSVSAITMAICGIIAFLGAVPSYQTRVFFIAAMAWASHACYFFGLSVPLTYVFVVNYMLFGGTMLGFAFKAIAAFPHGLGPQSTWSKVWPWLMSLLVIVPAASVITNMPLRAADMLELRVFTLILPPVVAISLMVRNYRRANNEQRRQLKWVILGSYLAAVPGVILSFLVLVSPEYHPVLKLFELTSVAFPICWLIAILGYRAFDVDRVFSAVVTYTITAGVALFLVAGFLPPVANFVIENSGIDAQLVYVLFAFAVCGALIPFHKYLKPRIEGWFFPARQRLDRAAKELSETLAQAETEGQLLNVLAKGLAEMQGASRWHITTQEQPIQQGHMLKLEPSVGERVFIQLGKKESGDVFTARDTHVMSELAQQSERLLLKLRNQELVIQRQAAEQLAAEKSLFLASASHDLRQPMHALGLFSESLSKRNRDERLAPLVEHINRSTKALDGMFNSILDLSKIDAGAMTAEPGAVYMQLLFEELELEFADIAKTKGLDLRFVPSSAVVWSDANLLARVLRNLISNAIRYTEKGKVLVGCRLGQDGVRIQVADTGRGISAADQKRIFTAYARVDNHVEGGLGLGLSLVDKLCGLLGHKLALSSSENRGSVFSIEVDRAKSGQAPAVEVGLSNQPAMSFDALRVLVVDDDPTIRLALHELLVSWRCEVESLDSLIEVSRWLVKQSQPPALVLVDLHLDERNDGMRILEAIDQKLGQTPALIITGDAQAGAYKWVAGHQVSILSKPLGADKLRSAIQKTLMQNVGVAGESL